MNNFIEADTFRPGRTLGLQPGIRSIGEPGGRGALSKHTRTHSGEEVCVGVCVCCSIKWLSFTCLSACNQ